MRICRADKDNVRFLRCIYHGWTYDTKGDLLQAFAEELYEPDRLKKPELGLIPVTQVESYHGMIFGTWSKEVPPLTEFLGDMGWYLDTLVARTPGGAEMLGTPQVWEVDANWKFAVDNFTGDPFHLPTAHGSIYQLGLLPPDPMAGNNGYAIDAGNGHQLLLSTAAEEKMQYYGLPPEVRVHMEQDADPVRRELIKNSFFNVGTVFPNLSFLQIEIKSQLDSPPTAFLNFRLWEPIGPTKTRVWSWVMVDKEMSAEFKKRSYVTYVRTFGPSGIYEQDDMENWEECTRVNSGKVAQSHDLHHGMGLHGKPSTDYTGRGTAWWGTFTEHTALAYYREWKKWIDQPAPWAGE